MNTDDLLDLLPTGVMVIDDHATVRLANAPILDLLGWSHDDYVGRSLLDRIATDDLDHVAALIRDGHHYPGRIMGPIRVGYTDHAERVRTSQLWARELPDRTGYLLVAPEESAGEFLADAVRSIAGGEPLDDILQLIVDGCLVHPLASEACVLEVIDDDLHPLTPWPLDDDLAHRRATPWELAGRSGVTVEVTDLSAIDAVVGRALAAQGASAVWCHPIEGRDGEVRAVLVVFRAGVNPPSANQRWWLRDIVRVAALAFDHHRYRDRLERAAFTDPLTGAATRAGLHALLDAGIESATVFYIDLDGFKQVNDRYGHLAGDGVLVGAVARMRAVVDEGAHVVRLGGDEFLVVRAQGRAPAAEASVVAAALVESLAVPYEVAAAVAGGGGATVPVVAPASVGVGFQDVGRPFDEALLAADEALAAAKRAGKQQFRIAGHDRSDRWAG